MAGGRLRRPIPAGRPLPGGEGDDGRPEYASHHREAPGGMSTRMRWKSRFNSIRAYIYASPPFPAAAGTAGTKRQENPGNTPAGGKRRSVKDKVKGGAPSGRAFAGGKGHAALLRPGDYAGERESAPKDVPDGRQRAKIYMHGGFGVEKGGKMRYSMRKARFAARPVPIASMEKRIPA